MLGRAANGMFWMSRYLERAENTARLLNVGLRIALTRGADATHEDEWRSVLVTTGQDEAYRTVYEDYEGQQAFNFILRDKNNPSSVLGMVESARTNARMVRTSITTEVWESTNECWMVLNEALARPVRERDLGDVLALIRRLSTQVRGAIEGTMLRNEVYNFSRIGTFIERADNTARILDVKYYVLLPSLAWVGSQIDNAQWDTLLRSVSGDRAYRWLNKGSMDPKGIAKFLILDGKFPRSLIFCYNKLASNMHGLAQEYGHEAPSHELIRDGCARLHQTDIDQIFEGGLHEFLLGFISDTIGIGKSIAADYKFVE
ncbi:MAG: alpha-E domain-containing protein [Novosphingobium sp.]|nr:alpha-E domain-containing protein [Novosphingobium sp.]